MSMWGRLSKNRVVGLAALLASAGLGCSDADVPSPEQAGTTEETMSASSGLAAVHPAPASTGVLDIGHVLHRTLPIADETSVVISTEEDLSLRDQIVIQICRLTTNDCILSHTVTSRSGLLEAVKLVGFTYSAGWVSSQAHPGERFRMAFRVAGLKLGSVDLVAVSSLLGVLQPGAFVPGTLVPIVFSIDTHPVVRTRVMHHRGSSAEDIAAVLKTDFALGVDDGFRVLFSDVRAQDVNFDELAGSRLPLLAIAAASPSDVPFTLLQLVNGVVFSGSWNATAETAATLARNATVKDAHNNDVPAFANQQIVDALLQSNLNTPAHPISIAEMLRIVTQQLGVTDPLQQLDLLVHAVDKNGLAAFSLVDILQQQITASPDLFQTALQALRHLQSAGYDASVALPTLSKVTLPGRAQPVAALEAAEAAIQLPFALSNAPATFSNSQIQSGLQAAYPTSDSAKLLTDASKFLVGSHCGAYTGGPDAEGIVGLTKTRNILSFVDVTELLRTPGAKGGCSLSPTDAGKALQTLYFAQDGVVDQATNIGKALASPVPDLGPIKPVDLVTALGTVLKGVPRAAGQSLACLAGVGASSAQGGRVPLVGTPDNPEAGVLGALANPQGASLFPSPFAPGVGNELDVLGRCLTLNHVNVQLPLRKVIVRYTSGAIPAAAPITDPGVNGELLVGRAGWSPRILSGSVPGRLGDILNAVKLPSAGALSTLPPALQAATTLPIFVAGSPSVNLSHDLRGCSPFIIGCTADFIHEFPHGNRGDFDEFLSYLGSDRLDVWTRGGLPGLPAIPAIAFTSGTTDRTQNGTATFLVPALPGTLALEAVLFGNNSLRCGIGSQNPIDAVMAAAIATPEVIYRQITLPGGDISGKHDIWASGHTSFDHLFDDKEFVFPFRFGFESNPDGICGGRWIRTNADVVSDDSDSYMAGTIQVASAGVAQTGTDIAQKVGQIAGKLTIAPGADPGNGHDYAIDPSTGGTLAGTGGLLVNDPDANFLSMLAATTGAPLTAAQLTNLLVTGFTK
ncbi:MAG TPA: hypothetical protein VGD37_11690 [Kofleriaceae bacterium]